MFKAFGHIALKEREWPRLNKLVCLISYNGTELGGGRLKPGFMIHRNTMIATPETLYIADDESCKLLDAATGKVNDEIPAAGGRSIRLRCGNGWRYNGVLFALVGEKEPLDKTLRGTREVAGWPWRELGGSLTAAILLGIRPHAAGDRSPPRNASSGHGKSPS